MHGKDSSHSNVTVRDRCLALFAYAGGLPILALLPRWRERPFVAHHYNHAAATILLLFMATAINVTVLLILSYLLVFHRWLYENVHIETHALSVLRKIFLCWAVIWGFAALLALLGSTRYVLLVSRLAAREKLVRVAVILTLLLCATAVLVSPLVLHATTLVRSDGEPGAAYFIYEDLDTFPRWLFALGFYRVALESRRIYGPGSAVILPLNPDSVARAKREGTFVVIGAHGRPRGMAYHAGWITPDDVRAMADGESLRYVYLSSCDSGSQAEAWQAAFAPAEVVTFDRLSAVVEHIWWLWFEAPSVLRRVALEGAPAQP